MRPRRARCWLTSSRKRSGGWPLPARCRRPASVPEVAALYRYPLKGFTPEACETLEVQPDGGVAGDRVLALRFADDPTPDDEWSRKQNLLVLMNTPALAQLQVRYDEKARRLRVSHDGSTLTDESIDGPGRLLIAAAIQ